MNTQFVVDASGKKTAVILPVEEYEELLEDIHDLAVIAERKDYSHRSRVAGTR